MISDKELVQRYKDYARGNKNLAQVSPTTATINDTQIQGARSTVISKRTVYTKSKPRIKTQEQKGGSVKILFIQDGRLFIGGDRVEPQEIPLPTGVVADPTLLFYTHLANNGTGLDDWVISAIFQQRDTIGRSTRVLFMVLRGGGETSVYEEDVSKNNYVVRNIVPDIINGYNVEPSNTSNFIRDKIITNGQDSQGGAETFGGSVSLARTIPVFYDPYTDTVIELSEYAVSPLANGETVYVLTGGTRFPTGLSIDTPYTVANKVGNTFQLKSGNNVAVLTPATSDNDFFPQDTSLSLFLYRLSDVYPLIVEPARNYIFEYVSNTGGCQSFNSGVDNNALFSVTITSLSQGVLPRGLVVGGVYNAKRFVENAFNRCRIIIYGGSTDELEIGNRSSSAINFSVVSNGSSFTGTFVDILGGNFSIPEGLVIQPTEPLFLLSSTTLPQPFKKNRVHYKYDYIDKLSKLSSSPTVVLDKSYMYSEGVSRDFGFNNFVFCNGFFSRVDINLELLPASYQFISYYVDVEDFTKTRTELSTITPVSGDFPLIKYYYDADTFIELQGLFAFASISDGRESALLSGSQVIFTDGSPVGISGSNFTFEGNFVSPIGSSTNLIGNIATHSSLIFTYESSTPLRNLEEITVTTSVINGAEDVDVNIEQVSAIVPDDQNNTFVLQVSTFPS